MGSLGPDLGADAAGPRRIALEAVRALGRGFDATADIRTKFCKRQVLQKSVDCSCDNISLPGAGITIPATQPLKCDKGECVRYTTDLMQFHQMSEEFNKQARIDGKIPLGHFNRMFDFTGSWFEDATKTKSLALDGKFITLYQLHLTDSFLLCQNVKEAVPSAWEPAALARFISTYGTHVIVGVNVGGQDVLYLKERSSSMLPPTEVHTILKNFGDQIFAEKIEEMDTIQYAKSAKRHNNSHAEIAHVDCPKVLYDNKEVIITGWKRGGVLSSKTHSDWQASIESSPDIILMSFVSITSLLSRIPGAGFLTHAINLYLRYKPPINDIQYFLEFQVPRQWAPAYNDLPLTLSNVRAITLPSLQFKWMGPRLYINTAQVSVGRKPVTGLRLYLEGIRNNQLAIHLQHLEMLPRVLEPHWDGAITAEPLHWRGSDDLNSEDWFEHVQCRLFSQVCTARVKYNPEWAAAATGKSGVFVVVGAQLEVRSHSLKNILHLRLQYARIPGLTVLKSHWSQPRTSFEKNRFFSALSTAFTSPLVKKAKKKPSLVAMNSGLCSVDPPKPVQQPKLLKFVDMRELTKGPQDLPGHWLVIGAQLDVDAGKISLNAKYALLDYNIR